MFCSCRARYFSLLVFASVAAACGGKSARPVNHSGITLAGCSLGGYHATVTLGGSQTLEILPDSGSKTIVVASSLCSNCSGVTPLYDPASSTNATDQGQTVRESYAGGNGFVGDVFEDSVSLTQSVEAVRMRIVAITRQSAASGASTALFGKSGCTGVATSNTWQGIMGLAPSLLGSADTDSFIDLLSNNGITPHKFTMQLCDLGGRMWLGDYDSNYTAAAPSYTPLDYSTGFYNIGMADMKIGDQSLGLSRASLGTTLVDSGTSILVVTDPIFQAISDALDADATWQATLGTGYLATGGCFTAPSRSELDRLLPSMSITFPKVGGGFFQTTLTASNSYLTPAINVDDDDSLYYCVAVTGGGGSSGNGDPDNIMGSSMMHALVAIFDIEQAQLGIAPSKGCTTVLQ